MDNIAIFDIVCIIIISIFAIMATIKGFIKEIFDKIAWVLALVAGFIFAKNVKPLLLSYIKIEFICNLVSFIIIFIIVFLIVQVIKIIISQFFKGEILRSLDKALGFFFGIIEGLAVVLLISYILSIFPFYNFNELFYNSFFFSLVSSAENTLINSI